jgi:hypothetical protein
MKITINKIKEIADDVLKETYESLKEEDIKQQMKEIVFEQEQKIILESLGLEKVNWSGEISIKYNGSFRKNLEILSDETLKPLAKQIWNNIASNIQIKLSEKEMAHLRKIYRDAYMKSAEEQIAKLAEEQANLDSPEFFEKYLKTLE